MFGCESQESRTNNNGAFGSSSPTQPKGPKVQLHSPWSVLSYGVGDDNLHNASWERSSPLTLAMRNFLFDHGELNAILNSAQMNIAHL